MKNPYVVFGLDSSADYELVQARYKELRALYAEQRFKPGEEGNEGARKLQEVEEAWASINANARDSISASFDGDYGKIDELIRQGNYNEAQTMLDGIQNRTGEWHYMQAIVFYKREWLTDAKTQLEMALRDDPGNSKYRSSLDKLNLKMGGPQQQQHQAQTVSGSDTNRQYGNWNGGQSQVPGQQADDMANCLSTCCMAYCLTDCLCNLMRCL